MLHRIRPGDTDAVQCSQLRIRGRRIEDGNALQSRGPEQVFQHQFQSTVDIGIVGNHGSRRLNKDLNSAIVSSELVIEPLSAR